MEADQFKKLDVVFTKSKKKMPFFSWAIRWWTNKPYSHVARAIEIRDWGKRYFQASEGKVNYEFEKYFDQKHIIVKSYTIEISKDIDRSIKHECYKEAGNAYATLQNVGIALLDIAYKICGKRFKNPWTKGRNCSEILLTAVFRPMFGDLGYSENIIKPHDIEAILIDKFELHQDGIWRRK